MPQPGRPFGDACWKRDCLRKAARMTTPRLMLITIIGTLAYLGVAILGWGGFAAFFSYPPLIALAITPLVLSGVAIFSGGNLSPRRARGSCQPLGHRSLRGDRTSRRLSAGVHRPEGVLDSRWGCHPLAWRRSLRCRRCTADLTCLCTRPPVQRIGGHPARAYAGYDWSLSSSATQAIWVCSLTRWAGRSLFGRGSARSFRRSLRAFVLKSGCCARSSATSTRYTAPARHGSFPDCIDAVMPNDPPAIEAVRAGWSS